jgi:long-chain acyl-CoA synthetase
VTPAGRDLITLLHERSTIDGERTAVVDGDRRMSWRAVARAVDDSARVLRSAGAEPGTAVGMVMANSPGFVVQFLAAARLGCVAVPLNPAYTTSELGRYLSDADVAVVVCDEPRRGPVEQALSLARSSATPICLPAGEAVTAPIMAPAGSPISHDAELPPPGTLAEAPVLYGYSSGSTGTPKRVTRHQRHLIAEADGFHASVGLDIDDVILAVVPLFHAHGLGNGLLASLRSGAALVVAPEFQRRATLELIRAEGVTSFPSVPFMIEMLAALPRSAGTDIGRLRWCLSAGAPLPRATFDAFVARYGVPVRNLYGCTEAGSVTANLADDPSVCPGSAGRPLGSVRVEVIGEHGRPCGPGETGEIVIASPASAERYDGLPRATDQSFRDGRFHTGDLGHLDESGALVVTGRTKLFIAANGLKVDPFEVEAVLARHPSVREAVVVGVPSADGSEIVKAVVVPNGTCDRKELIAWCRAHLAEFKIPRIVELRDEIPRSPLGKVLRKYLVEPAEPAGRTASPSSPSSPLSPLVSG